MAFLNYCALCVLALSFLLVLACFISDCINKDF